MAVLRYQPVSFSAHAALTALEAHRHLESIDTPVVSALPYKPKGGELFLVEVDQESKRNDWRSNRDGQDLEMVLVNKTNTKTRKSCKTKTKTKTFILK